jgi:hypothetical protein
MASPSQDTPRHLHVHTYHCLCSHLLLACTKPLSDLNRRTALDKSYILPLPSSPPSPPPSHADADAGKVSEAYALLPGLTPDRIPIVIRTADGFEKRYLHRCGRCQLVVAYKLDKSQYDGEEIGKRDDVIYLLPGGFQDTDEMVAGVDASSSIAFEGVSTVVS